LRNKPSVAQCDFCGWEFQDVSDEWISHVQVLEKMNRETDSIVLDDEVSKRIQSTIVRSKREPLPVPKAEPKVARAPVLASPVVKQDVIEADLRMQGKEWAAPSPPAYVATAEEAEVKTFVDTMIGEPDSAQAAAVVTMRNDEVVTMRMSRTSDLGEPRSAEGLAYKLSRYSMAFVGVGAIIYAVTLGLYSMAMLGLVVGWSMAILGAMLITIGASFIYDKRMAAKHVAEPVIGRNTRAGDEVIICPRCHEEVAESDERCPSCGAAFTH
jgi:hypothetical protein